MPTVSIIVNRLQHEAEVEPRLLLVHFLRDVLGLTGTHVGCDTSQCGACTVSMDGLAVKSCTILAMQANGSDVLTIEGIGSEADLHLLQRAFREHHGLQCGFCTPGMIMAATQILERYPDADDYKIRHELDGNICRCTGYRGIVEAVRSAMEDVRKGRSSARSALRIGV